ncbi:hypothetical protein AVEN_194412-1 [Araneus ventricosus]|uniref:Endonuclease/exonuclease/phosphatase domain-containing protein n=1 Tax=Araneus ventricosus TaxID=182803 RepID=A0A4Y2A609_ARAVE|nr:hypothetical protein AVEN_194412-1 [Araneus ventricosus]
MTFVQWNCRGLWNKRISLHSPLSSTAQFCIFRETFFNPDDHLRKSPFLYSHRQDRSGGVLLTDIPKIACGRILPTLISEDTNLEILATEIHYNNHKFIIVNLYLPQGFDIDQAKTFFHSLSTPVIIFGDFNLHHPMWGSKSSTSLSNGFAD